MAKRVKIDPRSNTTNKASREQARTSAHGDSEKLANLSKFDLAQSYLENSRYASFLFFIESADEVARALEVTLQSIDSIASADSMAGFTLSRYKRIRKKLNCN